jgi:trimeric autotransporter adhesin
MHTWVRRGLQTALVTGGLLMLGTGIASADESVNPDTPPGPVDAGVSVPIDAGHNALGTPLGQYETPSVNRNISTGDISGVVPQSAVVTSQANPLVRQAQPSLQALGDHDLFRGNKVVADVVVPVQLCGNAVAVGGDAHENYMCSQQEGYADPINTDGSNSALAGNVVAANGAIPVQGTGNAIAAVGNASSESVAGQSGLTGGDITTSGDGGTVSGTIGAAQVATPVQVADNAIAGGGNAAANSAAESDAASNGSLGTSGDSGTGAGTIGGIPVAVPFQLDGNGISGIGNASSTSQSTSNSTAGTTGANNIGLFGHPSWARTSGDPSTASGNIVQPQASGPVSVDDNAGGLVGNQSATSTNNSTDTAGGLSSTTGNGSTGSGNFVDAPVALPTSGAGNGAVGVGNATSNHTNNTSSTAGGTTLTNGDNSTLSGNSANVPPAGAVDACGAAAGGVGGATGQCNNNVTSTTGGYNGTTGNNGTVSGNMGQTPTTVPVEGYGASVGAGGQAVSGATETKTVTSGGTPNTHDDGGTGTSNVVAVPTAIPAQVFGDAVAGVGNSNVNTDSNTTTTAGGPPEATGRNATAAGNIVYVPSSTPTQVFGDTGTVVGNGGTLTSNSTTSTAGGDASSTGSGGSLSGNVAEVSNQVVNQAFGNAVSGVGIVGSNTDNTTNSKAGGDVTTTGDYSSLSGNAIAVPDTLSDQVFGDAVAAGSNAWANGTNDSTLASGGGATTTAIDGSGSGNAIALPVVLDPDAYGNAVSAVGHATGIADNESVINNGGDTTTNGGGSLSAYNFNTPLGADIGVVDVNPGILGSADTMVEDNSVLNNGFATPDNNEMALPIVGGVLGYGTSTPDASGLAGAGLPGAGLLSQLPLLSGVTGGQGATSGLTGGLTGGSTGGPTSGLTSGLTNGGLTSGLTNGGLVGGLTGGGLTSGLTGGLTGGGLPLLGALGGLGGAGGAQPQSLPVQGVNPGQLPSVPKLPLANAAVGKISDLPVQHVTGTPASMLQGAQAMSKGAPGISGVLPVQRDLFPKI